ncbi:MULTISPECIES: acyl-CoA dehydrogenase family protein [Spongiibacter]|uniref:acyl-CoA dehydrogenase family protein n=1 Tax=Spongiibacter TaxID=630749 RepID=UPI000C43FCC7|nr:MULTISPECIES: acyl-CoA dehydrogenase family protein [Spongiibacter]MAY37658.1 acyl-CoA dehydrogenase [Spongiibacter sp.]MBI57614.1 acyl-CoA dehydrogenase [Spongiibacter sp.]MBO6754111.1 acyl-CoA dehydrogenase family protein [Spongiibacter sp.]MBU70643.1 acyl-CoA dehydrogenase [Spongiibacter sp.]|tara:strand:- start:30869 stop:32095 length:1227 start_codon:yes stop_codon:yes gene_type:complete
MDLSPSAKAQELLLRLQQFMNEHIYPNEHAYAEQLAAADDRFAVMPLMDELKSKAKAAGLWNLFVPEEYGQYSDVGGLSFLDYAPLCEEMGRVLWSPEVFNCNAPDTGNMEVLMKYATDAQREQWLTPLLSGDIRSSYAMTEPQVASSDATNIELRIEKDGNDWVLNGRKWFITGAMNARTEIFIVMGKSDPDNPNRHLQQTQVLVPKGTPGVKLLRPLTTFGYDDAPIGHAEMVFENVRVPLENVLLGEGRGFEIAQGRLAPGRMHHCMRLIGAAQRSLELACQRAVSRTTFGRPLSRHQSVREEISRSFSEIEMARLLVLKTCKLIDEQGPLATTDMIAATKTTIPLLVQNVIDRCMQLHGAGGFTEDYMMAEAFNYARWCRQADGPDQVHQMALGKQIINRYSGE